MKIKSISISNSLSFDLQESTMTPNTTFTTVGEEGSEHILIGPNGAGKSNFIEIVNHCFRKALFRPSQLNESQLMAAQRGAHFTEDQFRNTLTIPNEQANWNLRSHDDSGSDLQRIGLALELNKNDFTNLEFLLSQAQLINAVLTKYSGLGLLIPISSPDKLRSHSVVNLTIEYKTGSSQIQIAFDSEEDPAISFIKTYLRNFQVFQMSISLYNRYVRPEVEPRWPELNQTFAMLGSYRNYAGINSSISIESNRSFQPVYDRLKQESTRFGGGEEPAVFEMVKRKIGYAFYDLYEDLSLTDALTRLYAEEPLVSINNLLSKYLNLQIRVNKVNKIDPAMEMHFDRGGRRIDTADLSSGEKGILHFIFTLYGFDLENGVLVIDEPELHLHPQIQKEYQAIINDIVAKLDVQFIIATHSPIFVGVDTIEEVYRFFKIDGHTEIVHPTITAPQKALVKILDLTNSSKIFFVTRVILVEGETDEYFLRFYFDYLRSPALNPSAKPWQRKIEDYEIINIKGKGARKTWTEFLESYGLQVAFVGDWDNVAEVASFDLEKNPAAYQKALTIAGKAVQQKGSADGNALFAAVDKTVSDPSAQNVAELKRLKDYITERATDYAALIRNLKANDPAKWGNLETAIDNSYAQKIFILKKGELEDYLGVQKRIEYIIDFCENRFDSWLVNSAFNSFRNELEDVIERIFQ